MDTNTTSKTVDDPDQMAKRQNLEQHTEAAKGTKYKNHRHHRKGSQDADADAKDLAATSTVASYSIQTYRDNKCRTPRSTEHIEPTSTLGCFNIVEGAAAGYSFLLNCSVTSGEVIQTIFRGSACTGPRDQRRTMKQRFFRGKCTNYQKMEPPLSNVHLPLCMQAKVVESAMTDSKTEGDVMKMYLAAQVEAFDTIDEVADESAKQKSAVEATLKEEANNEAFGDTQPKSTMTEEANGVSLGDTRSKLTLETLVEREGELEGESVEKIMMERHPGGQLKEKKSMKAMENRSFTKEADWMAQEDNYNLRAKTTAKPVRKEASAEAKKKAFAELLKWEMHETPSNSNSQTPPNGDKFDGNSYHTDT